MTEIKETVPDTSTPEETVKRTKVVFALPGDTFNSKFLIAWTATISRLWDMRKYEIMLSPGTGSYVPFVRMQTLGLDVMRGENQKPFDGQDFDIWVTLDSDVIFTPDQIISLLESTEEHPVVSGMYRMADLAHFAFVKERDTDYFLKNGTFKFSTPEDVETWKKETELKYLPVYYAGMGFMAVRREVLDKMKYPYFDSELEELVKEDGTKIRDICSEDVAFSKNVKKAGYDIVVNTDLRVGHCKNLII